jgi:tRNA nucleotidyltransferase (CCA-adding enzyme)
VKELEQNEFHVMRSFEWAENMGHERDRKEMAIVFEFEVWSLPPIQRMHGPPLTVHEHSSKFLEKYGKPMFGPFVDGQGSWFIEKQRAFKDAETLLSDFIRQPVKKLEEAGMPNFVASSLKRRKLLKGDAFWRWAKHPGISQLMWKKYTKKMR